jgi:2-polyprenyl-3-methyl-5-hydroxy-6-metoxy-1,4-benzoquinol methylase
MLKNKKMKENDIAYFNAEKNVKNPIFFDRFPEIKFDGLKVMDLGCGHGALSIDLALKGAKEVIGIDLNADRVNFANENLKFNYADLIDRITFKCIDLEELDDNYFDIIISKASFEHILDLDILLIKMKNKLKLGGKIITGFGPLYNSPWGDHNRLRHKLPWLHVIYGEKFFIKKISKIRKDKIESIYDLGLNGYSLKKYISIFNHTEGLSVIDFRTNVSNKFTMKLFDLFTYFPFVREYFTYNIYCVLERKK